MKGVILLRRSQFEWRLLGVQPPSQPINAQSLKADVLAKASVPVTKMKACGRTILTKAYQYVSRCCVLCINEAGYRVICLLCQSERRNQDPA